MEIVVHYWSSTCWLAGPRVVVVSYCTTILASNLWPMFEITVVWFVCFGLSWLLVKLQGSYTYPSVPLQNLVYSPHLLLHCVIGSFKKVEDFTQGLCAFSLSFNVTETMYDTSRCNGQAIVGMVFATEFPFYQMSSMTPCVLLLRSSRHQWWWTWWTHLQSEHQLSSFS